MGRATFADIEDGEGKVQLLFRRNNLSESYATLKELDIGDWIGATGPVFRTRTGEATVEVQDWTVLSKAVRGLPEKWHGLTDVEARFRQRYLDLIANEDSATDRRYAQQGDQRTPAIYGRSRLHGGGDAYARAGTSRWDRAAFRHTPQRPRPGPLPANSNGASPQAAHRGRHSRRCTRSGGSSATRAST